MRSQPITGHRDEIERNVSRNLLAQIGKKEHCPFQHPNQMQRLAWKIFANFARHLRNAALKPSSGNQDADALAAFPFGLRFLRFLCFFCHDFPFFCGTETLAYVVSFGKNPLLA